MCRTLIQTLALSLALIAPAISKGAEAKDLALQVALGKRLFFDTRLSEPAGQSCASCHSPAAAFATPEADMRKGFPIGANGNWLTPRNTPTVAYNIFSPKPYFDKKSNTVVGGLFWDQRAADAKTQAAGPLLNPDEMGNTDKTAVANKLMAAGYEADMARAFGAWALRDADSRFAALTLALSAYQRSREVNPFSSKFDASLRKQAALTAQERRGLNLFNSKKAGNCAACHISTPAAGKPPLFTDFTNDNLGVPKHPDNPLGPAFTDVGLAGSDLAQKLLLQAKRKPNEYAGRFKVPTLRNIALTAPYMHNGVFSNLKDVMRFYNTACAPGNPDKWPAAEVEVGRNCTEMGNLKLTEAQIDDIIAFMQTLTDGYIKQ
jgi:cytochrome c peroxidase